MNTSKKAIIEALAVNVILGILFFTTDRILPDSGVRYLFLISTGLATLIILIYPRFKEIYDEMLAGRIRTAQQSLPLPPPRFDPGDREAFHTRSFSHHQMVHHARDTAVKLMPIVPAYNPPPVVPGKQAAPLRSLEAHRAVIQGMLQQLAMIFSDLVPPGTRVWTCMRDRRADDCYHTFERAGNFTMSRMENTCPMHKDESRTVLNLKLSYQNGACVLITGSTKGPTEWAPSKNDLLGEDKSVLMGAVMTRSHDPLGPGDGWMNRKLSWIVCVCADRPDVFTTQHVPLLQCIVDSFSWLANTMMRNESLNWRNDEN